MKFIIGKNREGHYAHAMEGSGGMSGHYLHVDGVVRFTVLKTFGAPGGYFDTRDAAKQAIHSYKHHRLTAPPMFFDARTGEAI